MNNYIILNIFLILAYMYVFKKIKRAHHILQLESYKNERYIKWIKNNKIFLIKELIILFTIIIIFFNKPLGLIINSVMLFLLIISSKKQIEKKPLVITKRIKRMYFSETIIFAIVAALINITINKDVSNLLLYLVAIFINISFYIVLFINILNSPIEKNIQKSFYNKAKNKIKEMPNLKIIGITGSYGKTSTKYILGTILEQKYNVLITPESYNTTMGVVRTINEKLISTHQVFVCEMGAKNIGDIKEICDLVEPKYGVLTAVGPQHLDTFKTLENVKKTKMELIESLPEDGMGFVNYEDENIKKINFKDNTIKYGLNNDGDFWAENINYTEKGSEFDVYSKNYNKINVKTKLLGEHNILNIVAAVAVAYNLGLNEDDIKIGIRNIKPVQHRLELIQNNNGSIIIDDAYNSNNKGAKMALEVLGRFQNKKRILITPGIVDLGEESIKYNKILGNQASESADYIILVGKKQAEPILEGLREKNYPENQIFVAENLNEALTKMREIMDNNSVILLENDLPDNYL